MKLSAIAFLIGEAFRNIRRNGLMSLAAISTVATTMTVLGGAVYSIYRLQQFIDAQPRQFEISVFLRVETERDQTNEVKAEIEALPGVSGVNLVTKEVALASLQSADASRAETISGALEGANPLPDRLDVRLSDPALTASIATSLKDAEKFPDIETVRDDRETLVKLMATSRLVRNIGAAISLLLAIATAFVIQNTIRLTVFARRREIRIMQLVGATSGFIRLPMVIEGMVYGLLGSAVAAGIVLFTVRQIATYSKRFMGPLTEALPAPLPPQPVLVGFLVLGLLIGLFSTLFSLHRYLRRL